MITTIAARIANTEPERELIPNPFPSSIYKEPVYHGGNSGIKTFRRPDHGFWFSPYEDWVDGHYSGYDGSELYTCYVDVRNLYTPTDDEFHEYYGPTANDPGSDLYHDMQKFFRDLKAKGYDGYLQGAESGSFAIFSNAKVVNAYTGEEM